MPYRTRARVAARIHRLRSPPARWVAAPLVVLIASIVAAMSLSETPATRRVVSCSMDGCSLHHQWPTKSEQPISCEHVDDVMQRLRAVQRSVWHHVHVYESWNWEASSSVEQARDIFAPCLLYSRDSRDFFWHGFVAVYVDDYDLRSSAACLACGLLAAAGLLIASRRRGLTLEIDEGRGALGFTERGWSGPKRSLSWDLAAVDGIVVDDNPDARALGFGEHRLTCVLRTGERVVLARSERSREGRRYARVAARVRPILDGWIDAPSR